MKKIVDDLRLIYKCCCLYYVDEMSQQQICDHIGISRATVSRMLKAGRATGIVKIDIKNPVNLTYGQVERELEKKYGLKEVIVVDGSPLDSKADRILRINEEALNYLSRLFKDGDYIGVSMGSTLDNIVNVHKTIENKIDCTFVPVVGGVSSNQNANRSIHSNEIANNFANKFGGKAMQFFAPALFTDINVMKGFLKEKPAQEILSIYPKLNTVVMGVGIPRAGASTLEQHGYIQAQDVKKFVDDGAVGDISLKYFDQYGRTEKFTKFNDRVAGLSIKLMREIENRVGIATGIEKTDAILGAIRGDFINILITDIECADKLAKLEK